MTLFLLTPFSFITSWTVLLHASSGIIPVALPDAFSLDKYPNSLENSSILNISNKFDRYTVPVSNPFLVF